MENITKDLTPQKVFYFFEEISRIPRGSKKEKKISDWLVKFANDRNLEVYQDSVLNVVIQTIRYRRGFVNTGRKTASFSGKCKFLQPAAHGAGHFPGKAAVVFSGAERPHPLLKILVGAAF